MNNQRDEYLISMNHLTIVKQKREDKAQKKRDRTNSDMSAEGLPETPDKIKESPMSRLDALDRAVTNSMQADSNYQTALEKFNCSVDTFNENFVPIMGKIQEKDLDQSEFIKLKLEKFAGFISQFSTELGK